MTRPALAMLIALLLAACHGGSEAPPAASEGSAAATSTHDGEGSAEGAPARDMAAASGSGALPEGVVDHAPPAGFDPATQLVGAWTFDEERTRNSLSIELAAQLPAGMDATMTFDAPEGSGAGVAGVAAEMSNTSSPSFSIFCTITRKRSPGWVLR